MDMRIRLKAILLAAIAAGIVGMGSSAAKADSIVILSAGFAQTGSNWTYTYDVGIGPGNDTNNPAVSPSYINIFDFLGVQSATFTTGALGGSAVVDFSSDFASQSGTIPLLNGSTFSDLKVTFSGQVNSSFNTVSLGTLTAVSTNAPAFGHYGSLDEIAGSPDLNGGTTITANGQLPPATPLPAPMLGGGALMALLGVVKFTRREKSVA